MKQLTVMIFSTPSVENMSKTQMMEEADQLFTSVARENDVTTKEYLKKQYNSFAEKVNAVCRCKILRIIS